MFQVKEVAITEIKVKNRARQEYGDIVGLAASIEEKGLLQPITIDQHMNLIAGERRYIAHKHLKRPNILAVIRKVSGVIDAAEIELIENVQRKDLEWPERAKLERKIYDLKASVDKNWTQEQQAQMTGKSEGAVSRRMQLAEALDLLPELARHKTENDAWKEYKRLEEDVVRTHMLQKVPAHVREAMKEAGTHYMIGDAFEGMASIEPETCNFAEVDTPYAIDLDVKRTRNKDDKSMEEYNEWDKAEYLELFKKTADQVHRILRPDSFAVFWYGMSWHSDVLKVLRKSGYKVPDIPAIWSKGDVGQTNSPNTTLGSCYEPFFLVRKGNPVLAKPGRSNVFHFPKLGNVTKDHPTQKPLTLMKAILDTCLLPGSTILVPFLGSGVTLRAAYKTGHTGFGWDMSANYKDAFLKKVAEDVKEADKEEAEADED
jgi:adenine-specific DNA-methyltransferase